MNLLIKIHQKILKELILTISKFKIFHNKVFDSIFLFLLDNSGENIYYVKQSDKEDILTRIREISNLKDKSQNDFEKNIIQISSEIKSSGICSDLNIHIPQHEVEEVNNYFSKKYFFDSHTPHIENKKEFGEKPSGAYTSYDTNTHLNCKPVLKLCLNENIVTIAHSY